MRSILLSLALVLATASTARAQDFEAAGKHFSAAQDAFGKKHYKAAAGEFEAAYAISKDPVLYFNIGESWEKAGDGPKAIAGYRSYLASQSDAQDKGEVEHRIRAIEAKHGKLVDQSAPDDAPALAQANTGTTNPTAGTSNSPATDASPTTTTNPPSGTEPAAGQTTPTNPPPPTPPAATTPEAGATQTPTTTAQETQVTPAQAAQADVPANKPPPGILDEGPMSKLRVAAWIGVGATLALLSAGAILGLAAQSRSDEIGRQLSYVDTTNQPNKYDSATDATLANLRSDGQLYNALGIAFFSAAAASAVATTVMFVVDAKRPKTAKDRALQMTPSVAPIIGKSGAGFAATWRF
jgi:hypothetical protein